MKRMNHKKYTPTDQIEIVSIVMFNILELTTNITEDAYDEILNSVRQLDGESDNDRIIDHLNNIVKKTIRKYTYRGVI